MPCLFCSAVRALLTQTDTELDIHVRVLRVKAASGPVGVADLRGWMILQQTVREKIAADGALVDLPAPCFESAERPAAQAIEFCQCSPEELPKQLERAGVTTVEDGRRTVCFVVVVGPPTEPIRTHMEAAKSSSFVVSMVPPADSDDEGDSGEQDDGEDEGNTKGAAGGPPPGLRKLEQLRLRLKQNSRVSQPSQPPLRWPRSRTARCISLPGEQTKSGEPWVSLGYDDSVFDPRGSEPARLQLWPRTKEDASALALAATMTFRLCPSTPGGVICDAWHVHAAPELTSKRVCLRSRRTRILCIQMLLRSLLTVHFVSGQGPRSGSNHPGARVSARARRTSVASFARW
eukprot:COSAG02_NODE_1564_length_11912_cov_7.524676_3_plen_347_part_00